MSKIGESFGFVLAEALLCGCPVVTLSTPFKDNAQFEVVGDKIGGYCSTSVQDFVKRLLLVYDRKDDFSPDQLYDQIDSRYSEQALVQPLLKVYRALCDNDRSYLLNLSKSTFEVAQKIVDEQMKLYKLKGLFLKMMLEVLHTPFVFKAIAGLKKKL
jgi:hypothetical protein